MNLHWKYNEIMLNPGSLIYGRRERAIFVCHHKLL